MNIENVFSRQLRSLPIDDFEKRTFSVRKHLGGSK